jgi:hypothetical protein
MRAKEILALGRRSLLPLVGLTRFVHPTDTVAQVVAAIGNDPDEDQQSRLFRQLKWRCDQPPI